MSQDDSSETRMAYELLDYVNGDESHLEDNSQQAALNLEMEPDPHRSPQPRKSRQDEGGCQPGDLDIRPRKCLGNPTKSSDKQMQPVISVTPSKRSHEILEIEDEVDDDVQFIRAVERKVVPPSHVGLLRRIRGEKRKREDPVPLLHEAYRIFKDCNIFFFPNDDIDEARRTRIYRAVERGATWVSKWHPNTTHVVVDKKIPIEDVLEYGGVTHLSDNVIVVNQEYTPDCQWFRRLLDPFQPQYSVPSSLSHATSERRPVLNQNTVTKSRPPEEANVKRAKRTHRRETPIRSPSTGSNRSNSPANVLRQPDVISAQHEQESEDTRPTNTTDEHHLKEPDLDAAITEAKNIYHLPISRSPSPESSPNAKGMPVIPKWQRNFTCMQPVSQTASWNPNAHTISLLQQMANYYETIRDEWRIRAYRIAIGRLKKAKHEIRTAGEAGKISGIGPSIAGKIEEIATTNRLQRLENAQLEEGDAALKVFLGIYGVGFQQAQAWAARGLRTLDDLRTDDITLTSNQRIGLDHYNDFSTRIPRQEVTQLGRIVTRELHRIDPSFEVIIGGSYRRGATSSGDIDLIITHPTSSITYTRTIVLDTLVPRLFKAGFLTASLAETDRRDGTKWHGACVLPSSTSAAIEEVAGVHRPWRRIDLLLVPKNEMGAALLYFTGNDIFNRSMRLLARKKGMRLNQRGLYNDVLRGKDAENLTEGVKIAGQTERGVFEALGVEWREPGDREV